MTDITLDHAQVPGYLAYLEANADRNIVSGLRRVMERVVREAQWLCPKRTGEAAASIELSETPDGFLILGSIDAYWCNHDHTTTTGKTVIGAHFIEEALYRYDVEIEEVTIRGAKGLR